ncbi:MAG: FAD-binding oxidoreductase [Phycisphaeraceae bacterium]
MSGENMRDVASAGMCQDVASTEELAGLVRQALAKRRPLVDYGVAHGGLGHAPPALHTRFRLRGATIQHYLADCTVRAATGITMGQLAAALAPHRQFVPIDADDDLTLGECIVHNVYGPLRQGYGMMRDLLLGLRYLDGQGRDIRVGGRTVKNVAGYDVTRLLVGSLGELGIVHEATLRTYAMPEQTLEAHLAVIDLSAMDERITPWLLSDARSQSLSVEWRGRGWRAYLGYFGPIKACATQLRALEEFLGPTRRMLLSDTKTAMAQEHRQETSRRRSWRRQATALVKILIPPATTGAFCAALTAGVRNAPSLRIDALPAFGCVFAGGDLDAGATLQLEARIQQWIGPRGGMRIWHQRPAETVPQLAPVAPTPSDMPMLVRLKRIMDPQGIFNPGRYLPAGDSDSSGATSHAMEVPA